MSRYEYKLKRILGCLLLVRSIQAAIVYFAPGQFDLSTPLFLAEFPTTSRYDPVTTRILENVFAWDTVHFIRLVMQGITFEHEWVFCPAWWRSMRYFQQSFQLDVYDVLLAFVVFNNIVTIITTRVLYSLSYKLRKDAKFAYFTSFLIIVQPSGIFSTIAYSEPFVQLLCYTALLLSYTRVSKIENRFAYVTSGVLISLAFATRSNALLYGLIYIYDVLRMSRKTDKLIAFFTGCILATTLAYLTYIPYSLYCPARGEWCNTWSKSLVTYAQAKYWNVGFLNYFTPGNIPMFIIAAPQIAVLILSLYKLRMWSPVRGVWLVTFVYLFIQVTSMHVQIINRVCTFVPLHLWYVAHLLTLGKQEGRWWVRWWILWVCLQTGLFAMYLPPA